MNELDKTTEMLRRKAEGAPERAHQILKAVAEGMQLEMQERAPKKTGKMARSIRVEFTDPMTVSVTASVIAKYVEYGTKPHVIRPVRAEYLVFKSKSGQWVRTKKVNHPGTKAQPFIRPVVNEVFKDLGESLGKMGAALNDSMNT